MSDRWDSGRITGDECNGHSDMHGGMKDGLEGFSGYESIRERDGHREGLKKNRRGMTWCLVV